MRVESEEGKESSKKVMLNAAKFQICSQLKIAAQQCKNYKYILKQDLYVYENDRHDRIPRFQKTKK